MKKLTSEELMNFLSKDERESFWQELRDLQEDIQFFRLFMKRNKKSMFQFDVLFTNGITNKFLIHLWDLYGRYDNDECIQYILTEYKVAKRLMEQVYEKGPNEKYAVNDMEETRLNREKKMQIVAYFMNKHKLKLSDYVSDFIGCSKGCAGVSSELIEIENKISASMQ